MPLKKILETRSYWKPEAWGKGLFRIGHRMEWPNSQMAPDWKRALPLARQTVDAQVSTHTDMELNISFPVHLWSSLFLLLCVKSRWCLRQMVVPTSSQPPLLFLCPALYFDSLFLVSFFVFFFHCLFLLLVFFLSATRGDLPLYLSLSLFLPLSLCLSFSMPTSVINTS